MSPTALQKAPVGPMGAELAAGRLSISTKVSFATIAGRNVLFDETDQKLFEINDTAAYIWCAVADGLAQKAILQELRDQGLAPETAQAYVETAVHEWIGLGFMRPAPASAGAFLPDQPLVCQDIQVAGTAVRIRYATGLACAVAPVFDHLEVQGIAPDLVLELVERGEQVDLFRNDDWLFSCSHEELATLLKGQLLEEVLGAGIYELALHAASLVRTGRMLLLCGRPGAGKTTLTLALLDAGFGFAGDDLALLDAQGHVSGVPFAPAVKEGAWDLVAAYRPDIYDTAVFCRPDRQRVRYPAPRGLVPASPYPVGWLVLLDRHPEAAATLAPVDPITAVSWTLAEGYAQGRRLTTTGFRAVGRAVDRAEYFRLTYSRLEDAVELLQRACR